MAGIATEQSDSKLNTELNLVPFIDLLSTLVLFLLVTAVWLQISSVPASVDSAGKTTTPVESTPQEDTRLKVRLSQSGIRLQWPEVATKKSHGLPSGFAKKTGKFDLNEIAGTLSYASKNLGVSAVVLSSDDSVTYGEVVAVLDALKASKIGTVSLATE